MTTISDIKNAGGSLLARSSIRRKLTSIIIGVSFVALFLSGILITVSQVAIFRNNMAVDHSLQAQMVANNCLAAVSFDDTDDASKVLETLSALSSLAYASVKKSEGQVLAFYRRDGFSDEPQPLPVSSESMFTKHWLLTQESIVLDGRIIGTVFLQSDLSDIAVFRRQMIPIVFGCLLFVLLMAWIASLKLQRFISEPIERLTGMVRDISLRSDYSVRAANIGEDEVGVLARAFNDMLSEVELRDEQLRERERKTQEYLGVAGVMIVALDPDGIITLMNPKGCDMLGLDEKDIVGKRWVDNFVPERLRKNVKKAFGSLIRGEMSTTEYFENELVTGSGEERLIAWRNSVIRDEEGLVRSVLSSGEDITDSRHTEEREIELREKLARAERMRSLGVLAGGVAHDLNNILGPMVVLPELIEEDMDAAAQGDATAHAEIMTALGVMKSSAGRAASVVRDLVMLSRRGHYELLPADLNKMSCLSSSSSCIQNLGKSHPNVSVALRTCSDSLIVLASEHHLCRVVDNVIGNAVESIDGKGMVTVTTSKRHLDTAYNGYTTVPPGEYAIIEVTDSGIGMEQEHLSRIFEPFYTKKGKTDSSGSGLGLSIVHGVIDDHDGYIDVKSAVGRGTTFILYLPLTSSTELSPESDDGPLRLGTERILIVDDEAGQRFLANNCLKRLGYTLEVAENGHDAVRLFTEAKGDNTSSPYDLILMDMLMAPGFDGLDALKEILSLYPKQKVIISSGHAEDDRVAAALELGAMWLAKPYTLTALNKAVADSL